MPSTLMFFADILTAQKVLFVAYLNDLKAPSPESPTLREIV